MKIKYSDVVSLETDDIKDIKRVLELSIKNAKKYGDSFCEIGKTLISFGKNEFDDRIEITSYIHGKTGDYLRKERSKKELFSIVKYDNKII